MGLFGNSNKKVEKVIDQLKRQGATSESYKERKSCSSCKYFSSIGNCNYHNKRTIPSELCNHYWGK